MIRAALIFLFVLGAHLGNANAQVPPPVSYVGMDHIARIIAGTPGLTVIGITDGVTVAAGGAATVSVGAINTLVPVTATATIGKAAMAKAAAKFLFTGLSGVGTAITAYQVYQWYADSGYYLCPAGSPNVFCKTLASPGGQVVSGQTGYTEAQYQTSGYSTALDACIYSGNRFITSSPAGYYNGPPWLGTNTGVASSTGSYCYVFNTRAGGTPGGGWAISVGGVSVCPVGSTLTNGACVTNPAPQVGFASEPEVETAFTGTNWDPNRSKKLYDALVADRAYKDHLADLFPPETPIAWNAPPVTIPQTVVKTADIANPDGTHSTETTKIGGTITPTPAGPTLLTPGLGFPTTINTTITNINNTTNAQTVNTTNNTLASPVAPADYPTDYARDVTVGKIVDQLSTDGAPTYADQEARQKTEFAKTDSNLDTQFKALPPAVTTDKTNWFSWVWTPPVGVCAPFQGTVHGYAIAWDLCPWVNNIRDALGWLFALFGAWTIYGYMFKGDS
jgi:hypothetical protein